MPCCCTNAVAWTWMGGIGAVLGELRITMADDADGGGGCTIDVLQQLLNGDGGDMCVCGTWHQYGNHNGGWAAVDSQDPAHGCENAVAPDNLFCLCCQAGPGQQCDQHGRVIPRQSLHVHPQRGYPLRCPAPTGCSDVWPGMVRPTCRYDNQRSCFMI